MNTDIDLKAKLSGRYGLAAAALILLIAGFIAYAGYTGNTNLDITLKQGQVGENTNTSPGNTSNYSNAACTLPNSTGTNQSPSNTYTGNACQVPETGNKTSWWNLNSDTGELGNEEGLEEAMENIQSEADKDVEKILDEETKNTETAEHYTEILTEEEREMYEGKIKMLHLLDKYDDQMGNGPRHTKPKDPHHLHEYLAFIAGSSLVTLGFLYNKIFLTFAVIGLAVTISKSVEMNFKGSKLIRLIRNHPVYYLLGLVAFTLLFIGAGYSIPPVDLSLTELLVSTLFGV